MINAGDRTAINRQLHFALLLSGIVGRLVEDNRTAAGHYSGIIADLTISNNVTVLIHIGCGNRTIINRHITGAHAQTRSTIGNDLAAIDDNRVIICNIDTDRFITGRLDVTFQRTAVNCDGIITHTIGSVGSNGIVVSTDKRAAIYDNRASAITAGHSAFTARQFAAVNSHFTISADTDYVSRRCVIHAAFNGHFAAVFHLSKLTLGADITTLNGQLLRNFEQRIVDSCRQRMPIQIQFQITAWSILIAEVQISGQSDTFVTLRKGFFEIPYSTDISRGC